MDRAAALIFPGSRTLTGWWRQLQPYQPQSLHVGYGFVHRVEALVQVLRNQPIDACTHLILQAHALAQEGKPEQGISLDQLCQRLGLPQAVLRQLLLEMEKADLLKRSEGNWFSTERGKLGLSQRQVPIHVRERRVFSFLERLNASGQRMGPPSFLPIAECGALAWQVEETHRFEPSMLQMCIAESSEWKKLRGFPLEIESVVQDSTLPAWQQVIVDRPERLLLVLIQVGKGESAELLGFAARADGWVLSDQSPILRLSIGVGKKELELTDPPDTAWQDAWRSWCRQRNLPQNEVESCSLRYQSPRLEVQAPERLVQRLRAAKSDLLKGEAWLLLGDGYLRIAALLALV